MQRFCNIEDNWRDTCITLIILSQEKATSLSDRNTFPLKKDNIRELVKQIGMSITDNRSTYIPITVVPTLFEPGLLCCVIISAESGRSGYRFGGRPGRLQKQKHGNYECKLIIQEQFNTDRYKW